MSFERPWSVLRAAFTSWSDHNAPRMGAALAFYTLLSIAPLLILVVAFVSVVLGHTAAEGQIIAQVQGMAGNAAAEAVRGMLQTSDKPAASAASFVGIVTLLFGASGVFGELRSALNNMWDLKPKKSAGLWSVIRERVFSFGMVLAVGFLLLVSLLASAMLAAVTKFSASVLPAPPFVMGAINLLISLVAISFMFALIYRFVPETAVRWRDVWVGAIATGFLFTLGKDLLGIYLGRASVGSAYGAAGSLVVLIVWVYYSALIFLFGAEVTQLLRSDPLPLDAPKAPNPPLLSNSPER
jgi:membrane protein